MPEYSTSLYNQHPCKRRKNNSSFVRGGFDQECAVRERANCRLRPQLMQLSWCARTRYRERKGEKEKRETERERKSTQRTHTHIALGLYTRSDAGLSELNKVSSSCPNELTLAESRVCMASYTSSSWRRSANGLTYINTAEILLNTSTCEVITTCCDALGNYSET